MLSSQAKLPRARRRLGRRGAIAVESAVVAPLLFSVLLPMADLSLATLRKMAVIHAAEAGARYAWVNGWTQSAVAAAVVGSTAAYKISASPAPTEWCGCPDPNGSGITSASCGSICPGNVPAGTYVTASATLNYTPISPVPILQNPTVLAAQSTIRIQ